MADLEAFMLDRTRVERRMAFLVERAGAHRSHEHGSDTSRADEMACAGTLLKDAACLAMLLDDYNSANEWLQSAGRIWADIGLFAGYALLRLSGTTDWVEGYASDLIEVTRMLEQSEVIHEEQEGALQPDAPDSDEIFQRKPYLQPSSSSYRQLLNLLQSVDIRRDDKRLTNITSLVRRRFEKVPAASLNGIRLQSYIHLLDDASSGRLDGSSRDLLISMILNRSEQLAIAQADLYHWESVINPAPLVDFDLLALCYQALGNDAINEIMSRQSTLVALPWVLAQELASHPARSVYSHQ